MESIKKFDSRSQVLEQNVFYFYKILTGARAKFRYTLKKFSGKINKTYPSKITVNILIKFSRKIKRNRV